MFHIHSQTPLSTLSQLPPIQGVALPTDTVGKNLLVEELLQNFVDFIVRVFGVKGCLLIRSPSDPPDNIVYTSPETLQKENLLHCCFELLESYEGTLKAGRSVTLSQLEKFCSSNVAQILSRYQFHSLLIVPLLSQKSYLGGIFMYHPQSELQWQDENLKFITHLSHQCANAIEHYQSVAVSSSHRWQQQLIQSINQKLNSNLDSQTVVKEILEIIGQGFQVDRVAIIEINQNTNNSVNQQWQTNVILPQVSFLEDNGFQEIEIISLTKDHCIHQFCPYFSLDNSQSFTELTNNHFLQPPKLYCSVITPIFIRNTFFGLLIVETLLATRSFQPDELETLEIITDQIAIALYHCQHQQCLEKLEQEKKQAESATQIKSEVLSYMNHEVRNPLAGILGFARMLKEEIYGPLNEKQMQYATMIGDCGDHVLALINNFLDLSKIDANREELLLEKVVVEELCRASIAIVQEQARQKELALNLEIAPDIGFCTVDRVRIKQILVNLLSNAIKFTEVGAVTLKVYYDQDTLKFDVIDTGIGIQEADQHKLFEAFQQIHNHLSRKHKGTGLGLALSRKLARLHGGDLKLTSTEGKGSCFTLDLPR